MPRPPRADEALGVYHALNRGNLRATIFHKDAGYVGFENSQSLCLVSCLGIGFEANRSGFKTETDASKRLVDRIGLGEKTWGHDTFMCGLDFLPLDLR